MLLRLLQIQQVLRVCQLVLALLVAGADAAIKALGGLVKGDSRKARELKEAARSLVPAVLAKQEVPDELVQARLAVCRACPLFFRPLQTCGSPLRGRKIVRLPFDHGAAASGSGGAFRPEGLAPQKSLSRPLSGCFCHMPTKARLHENCWAHDERLPDLGWPAALNSFPLSPLDPTLLFLLHERPL